MSEQSNSAPSGDGWETLTFDHHGPWGTQWPSFRYRRAGDIRIDVILDPPAGAANNIDAPHGGFLASLAEQLLSTFAVVRDDPVVAVTVSLSFDYPVGGRMDRPIEGELELTRETRRMQFVRVTLRQQGEIILAGSGVLRKISLR